MTTAQIKVQESRHIPDGYRFVHGVTQDTTEGYYKDIESPSGTRYVALVFIGRAIKPTIHCYFNTEEKRREYVNQKIQTYLERKKQTKARKIEMQAPHTLEVGDIMNTSWGYDQTNVDYFQVTRVVSNRTVELRKISLTVESTEGSCDYVVPVKDSFIGEPMTKRVSNGFVKIYSFASASKWNGKANYQTNPYFGH